MKYNLKWTFGNSKLKKLNTVGFGIPAFESADGFKTCPQAGACAAVCYARQGTFTWPVVKAAREFNLAAARRDIRQFQLDAIADLARIAAVTVRVHDSGDFFSQNYLDAWAAIARTFPGKRFYAYTKSLHLDFSGMPGNFQIIQSQGGKLDAAINKARPHSVIFASVAARKKAGYVDGNKNDSPAINGDIKIGLVYHGVKRLTAAQSTYFGG